MSASPAFWNDLITEKSWKLLQEIHREFRFVLIGGWAVYLYTRSLKSKDIDVVVDYDTLYRLRERHPLTKNDRLKKYEIRFEDVDVDIYVPNFSNPGIPAETILREAIQREGFNLPSVEHLLLMKENAHHERQGSAKGEKDGLDLLSLLRVSPLDWDRYRLLADRYNPESPARLKQFLATTHEALPLGLDRRHMTRLKRDWLAHLEEVISKSREWR